MTQPDKDQDADLRNSPKLSQEAHIHLVQRAVGGRNTIQAGGNYTQTTIRFNIFRIFFFLFLVGLIVSLLIWYFLL